MSLLSGNTAEITGPGLGKPLPDRIWRALVTQAQVTATNKSGAALKGTRLDLRLSQFTDRDGTPEITLPDGSTYRPGNRIVFDQQWIDHENEKATEIGQRSILALAMSAGLAHTNGNGKTEITHKSWEDFANDLVGKTVTVKTKQVRKRNADGSDAFEEDGTTPAYRAEVHYYVVEAAK